MERAVNARRFSDGQMGSEDRARFNHRERQHSGYQQDLANTQGLWRSLPTQPLPSNKLAPASYGEKANLLLQPNSVAAFLPSYATRCSGGRTAYSFLDVFALGRLLVSPAQNQHGSCEAELFTVHATSYTPSGLKMLDFIFKKEGETFQGLQANTYWKVPSHSKHKKYEVIHSFEKEACVQNVAGSPQIRGHACCGVHPFFWATFIRGCKRLEINTIIPAMLWVIYTYSPSLGCLAASAPAPVLAAGMENVP